MDSVSVVKNFAVGSGSISVDIGSEAVKALWLVCSLQETRPVELEHGLEQIMAAAVENLLYLSVAGVLEKALIIQVALIQLNLRPLIAEHEFLEREEAHVPSIAFLVRNESRKR